jgi:hypothetical protein
VHTAHRAVLGEPPLGSGVVDHPAPGGALRSRHSLEDRCTDPAPEPFGVTVALHGSSIADRKQRAVPPGGSVPAEELLELIDHSYELVVAGLTRAERKELNP